MSTINNKCLNCSVWENGAMYYEHIELLSFTYTNSYYFIYDI